MLAKNYRFPLSFDWKEQFSDVVQRRLPRLSSDHFPLLLDFGVSSRRSQYFKFENMWLKSEGLVDQVKIWWKSYNFQGCPSFVLAHKLRALKMDLKKWNEEILGLLGRGKMS